VPRVHRAALIPRAARQLTALPREAQARIDARILALEHDPRPPGVKKLQGEEGFYRIRVGDYRVVCSIDDKDLLLLVVRIAPRGEVYRRRGGR
jgi:mRNA interferase RelE/StbE